jgi:hypothetical protein
VPAIRSAEASSPVSARQSRAERARSTSRATGRRTRNDEPDRACTASVTLSSTVKAGRIEVIWNDRAKPRRTRSAMLSCPISAPSKRISPLSDPACPDSCATSVVLPAPFGPMTA